MELSRRRGRTIARLHRSRSRRREGLVLVEGVRAVAEALAAGAAPRFAVTSPGLGERSDGPALLTRLAEAGIEVVGVTDEEVTALSDTRSPQGVLLVCVEPEARPAPVRPGGRYLVLDAVRNPGNAGALVRAAVAFGLDGVLALDGTADLWSPKAVRSAAGMTFRIPVAELPCGGAIERLTAAGLPLLVADAEGPAVAGRRAGGWALLVGNEAGGVRATLHSVAAAVVRVPMIGPAESLNVAMAAAVLLYSLTGGRGG